MSIVQGTNIIAGIGRSLEKNANNLLEARWFDHIVNNIEWLRADTFSWQDGTVYTSAYNHLSADISGKTLQSETIGAVTVQFYLADDGHKICPASEESNVASIYTNTGVAWYYILDTTNTRFKLPRTKYGFNGLRDTVGNYIPESLPNIKGDFTANSFSGQANGAFNITKTTVNGRDSDYNSHRYIEFDASRVSSTYQDNAPVQQRATQMCLYFYVGEFSQSATEQTAGLNAELFNSKVDKDDLTECKVVIETYVNGTSGYRIWSDGYCEQWGLNSIATSNTTVSLLKNFIDTNYNISTGPSSTYYSLVVSKNYNEFTLKQSSASSNVYWKASGYLAEDE